MQIAAFMPAQIEIDIDEGKLVIEDRAMSETAPKSLKTWRILGGPLMRMLGEGVNVVSAVNSRNPFQMRIVSPDALGDAITKLMEALTSLPSDGREFFDWWLAGVTFHPKDGSQPLDMAKEYTRKPTKGEPRRASFAFMCKVALISFWSQSSPLDDSLQRALEPLQAILTNIQHIGQSLSTTQKES